MWQFLSRSNPSFEPLYPSLDSFDAALWPTNQLHLANSIPGFFLLGHALECELRSWALTSAGCAPGGSRGSTIFTWMPTGPAPLGTALEHRTGLQPPAAAGRPSGGAALVTLSLWSYCDFRPGEDTGMSCRTRRHGMVRHRHRHRYRHRGQSKVATFLLPEAQCSRRVHPSQAFLMLLLSLPAPGSSSCCTP